MLNDTGEAFSAHALRAVAGDRHPLEVMIEAMLGGKADVRVVDMRKLSENTTIKEDRPAHPAD
jgi:hypothetical protein